LKDLPTSSSSIYIHLSDLHLFETKNVYSSLTSPDFLKRFYLFEREREQGKEQRERE